MQGLKFHQTHGRARDAKPGGLTPLVRVGDAEQEVAEDKLPPATSDQSTRSSLSASTNC